MAPPSFINFSFIQPTGTTEGTLFQMLAGSKLELGAMMTSDWPFGLHKRAWLPHGPVTLGHELRVEEEGNKQMNKTPLQNRAKEQTLLPERGLSHPISPA